MDISFSPPLWRVVQRQTFTDWEKLAYFLELDKDSLQKVLKNSKFSLNLPLRLANKIVKGTLDDPILKQFLPVMQELEKKEEYLKDPVGDLASRRGPKLLHKYRGRALLTVTGACAMHCRYCFRRHFDYDKEDKSFEEELAILKEDSSIQEIILSGGDPLSLRDEALESLFLKLSEVPHIKRIRIHTRFPIGIPERISETLLELFAKTKKQIIFVVHINHPRELDEDIIFALKKIGKLGIPLLNQSVLLKGVNDSIEVLKELFELLTNNGIMPYYLHQLDKVQGASHFEVPEEIGKTLIKALENILPGYAAPKYVREIPGKGSKTLLA